MYYNDKKVTIMADSDLDKKLRTIQAQEIIKTQKSVSFSGIMNNLLRKSLK